MATHHLPGGNIGAPLPARRRRSFVLKLEAPRGSFQALRFSFWSRLSRQPLELLRRFRRRVLGVLERVEGGHRVADDDRLEEQLVFGGGTRLRDATGDRGSDLGHVGGRNAAPMLASISIRWRSIATQKRIRSLTLIGEP
jgi:hypothetical protein